MHLSRCISEVPWLEPSLGGRRLVGGVVPEKEMVITGWFEENTHCWVTAGLKLLRQADLLVFSKTP